MKQLFPKEIIEHTSQVHQFEYRAKSSMIYTIILGVILIALFLLPFIEIPIYTTARGILKSRYQRVPVQSLYSGKVTQSNINENQRVNQGDTLFMLQTNSVKKQLRDLQAQQLQKTTFIKDLKHLIHTPKIILDSIHSGLYQKEWLSYQQQLAIVTTKKQKTRQHLNRSTKLYRKNVIPKVEFENAGFEHRLATKEVNRLQEQYKNTWQSQQVQYQNELDALKNQTRELQQRVDAMVIKAPRSGILKNVLGIKNGSIVSAGQSLAEIVPDTGMIAECYISPKDIGMIYPDHPVNFQVDAFNYNQWGQATGKILAISKDIDEFNGQSVFKIQCVLDQDHLRLTNGFKGKLNHGMTLSARFFLTERSLFDLLYDTLDDWLNPAAPRVALASSQKNQKAIY